MRYSLRILHHYQPQWTKPFLVETKDISDELEHKSRNQPLTATFALLAVALGGLMFEIIAAFFPSRQALAIYPTLTWVCKVIGAYILT